MMRLRLHFRQAGVLGLPWPEICRAAYQTIRIPEMGWKIWLPQVHRPSGATTGAMLVTLMLMGADRVAPCSTVCSPHQHECQ